jgi:hypothetical protein
MSALRPFVAIGLLLALLGASARAEVAFAPEDWAIRATFPAEPKVDDQRSPTPQGDELALRRYVELGRDRFMVVRFVYPVVPDGDQRHTLYKQSVETLMNSRAGQLREDGRLDWNEYAGLRLLIEHAREKTFREVRFVLIGASLYVASAEWSGGKAPSPAAARFLASLAVQAAFANARVVEERERFREIVQGPFRLRYDASRWFRDPAATEANSILLLRVDEMAEAEFTSSPERNAAPSMEETVLARARESAESVKLVKRGRKLRGASTLEELRFTVRSDGVTYENHGYFYSGAEGTVQVRAWSPDRTFARVAGDIAELLDGLTISRGEAGAGAGSR